MGHERQSNKNLRKRNGFAKTETLHRKEGEKQDVKERVKGLGESI